MEARPIHKFWWLWLPLLALAAQIALELTLDSQTLSAMLSENGPHEFLQALVIGAAFIVAAATLMRFPYRQQPWLAGWFGLAALCCLYVFGEEISWGQHLFGWATPEYWKEYNDQHETNLHNTSSWLDQKPRLILEIGVITGGLLVPLAQRYKPSLVPQRFAVIYPPATLGVIAAIVLGLKLIDLVQDFNKYSLFVRVSELIEIYLFYFILLYLVYLRRRVRLSAARETSSPGPGSA